MSNSETIILGGGCFWCLDASFSEIKGVRSIVAGYAGGELTDPNYEKVCSGETGHAEVVKIEFDPEVISLADILHIFFAMHDPTTRDRQGNDVGSQYRSIILYENDHQLDVIKAVIRNIQGSYDRPIVTELKPLEKFYPAEEYHQKYFAKNPEQAYCRLVIRPKLASLRKKFPQKMEPGGGEANRSF